MSFKDSSFFGPTPGLGRRARRLSAWVVRVGWWRATVTATLASALASLVITRLWLWLKGEAEMGDALWIALGVPLPITFIGAGLTLRLLLALESARARVQDMAMTDGLTGVSNRRWFMHLAQRHFELARRHGQPLALMLFDLDHFKRINDEHGHLEGDRLLAQIGRRCQALMRSSDVLARFGGEEFVVLLPNTSHRQAVQLAERLRAVVAQGEDAVTVTVSIGVVALAPDTPGLDALIQAADEALYAAKRAGRDRVHAVEPTAPMLLSST